MSDHDEDAIAEEFWEPGELKGIPHPAEIAARVVKLDEHKHLAENEVRFLWLMRASPATMGGREVIGMVHEVDVKGRLRDLFFQLLVKQYGFMPDFIVTMSAEWWREATPLQREALVHHELAHVRQALDKNGEPRVNKQTGEPILALVAHDLEEFQSTVERYGDWKGEFAPFVEALKRHV